MKVILNKCFGGFVLSDEGYKWLIKKKGWRVTEFNNKGSYKDKTADIVKTDRMFGNYYFVKDEDKIRINPDVIQCIEELGKKANGIISELVIINIPDDLNWEIDDYDGIETLHEIHRKW